MIFVTVGTHEQPFDRLIKKIDELVGEGVIKDVFIQSGYCKYKPVNCDYAELLTYEEMEQKTQEAEIVITHGGPASFVSAIEKGKIPVVVPRQARFGEHVNDHQAEFCNKLVKRGFPILVINDVEDLKDSLTSYAKNNNFNYKSNTANFNSQVLLSLKNLFS